MELIDDTLRFLKGACPRWRPHLLLVLGASCLHLWLTRVIIN